MIRYVNLIFLRKNEVKIMPVVAAIQMNSGSHVIDNLKSAEKLIQQAVDNGAGLIVLPEMFATFGLTDTEKTLAKEALGQGTIQDFLAEQALRHSIWLVGGTIPIIAHHSDKVRAACLVFNAQGERVARYDKIHLFDALVKKDTEVYQESRTVEAGGEVVVLDTPFGKLGIAVCYDIRFPELFRNMFARHVEIIALPSAFTVKTGEAHWEILLRAQAIQNFSYLVAAGQVGQHPNGRMTYGHSMIVEPWGHVVSELAEGVGVVTSDIDLNYLHQIREDFPVAKHRRL
jgi:nitrilase